MSFIPVILAAAATDGGGWISGETLTTILTILCGAGGVVGGKIWGERAAKKIKADLKQPFEIEQSSYQAAMKANEHDHENIFNRLRILEKDMSGLVAKVDATLPSISEQLRETKEMVRQLFDRIICRGGKK